ncbi:ankyrin repeat, SAM and basic leucine zipper domain-containing protein 1 [Culicoides brevitarsis]|uniref:ankyrin repeat, SAM and basic leucine zipper domain-containing protein 1 n=1 Tax=Culicoides brevitarsis TaxID=469753 RepID=UPI00307C5E6B
MYRPGGLSDSDDYSDEFDDGFDRPKQRAFRIVKTKQEELEEEMYQAIVDGDLQKLKSVLESVPINLDDTFRSGYTLLMYACVEAHPEIVRFLIEKGATVNMEVESFTPLMMACRAEKDSARVFDIVQQLMANGAVVNQSSVYGETPLIFACQNGHTEVVRLIIKEASLDACNNQLGNTAIFFAVEKNHLEIVKLLLEHGASYNITNRQGYLPKVIAEMHGFADIVDLFPKNEEIYQIPDTFLCYQHYTDQVPGLFGQKPAAPPYFYRIREILNGLELDSLLPLLAKSSTSLPQFLTMNEEKLSAAGIDLPIFQKKILHGLLRFHAHKWAKTSIAPLTKSSHVDHFHVFSMMAAHLQHLVVLRCSLVYILQLVKDHPTFPKPQIKEIWNVMKNLETYMQELHKIFVIIDKKRRVEPKIDEITAEKAKKMPQKNVFTKKIVKFSSVLGVFALVGVFLIKKLT